MTPALARLVERFRAGDQRALAQAISRAEEGEAAGQALLRELFGAAGRARVYGITGAPGAGKSTLVECLALELRARGRRVAIVAVDPSSPFTGGAVLGDRVRMTSALEDGEVYMRSLANRGHLGGLSAAADDTITLLDAFGFDAILVETVGTGQAEVEIMQLADATVVVVVPGLGDQVQAMKAGILEIADVYAVNKADRDMADRTVGDLVGMLELMHMGAAGINRWPDGNAAARADDGDSSQQAIGPRALRPTAGAIAAHLSDRFGSASPGSISWRPPVLKTVATDGRGVAALVDAIAQHDEFLRESGRDLRRARARAEARLRQVVAIVAARRVLAAATASGEFGRAVDAIVDRERDPYSAAEALLGERR